MSVPRAADTRTGTSRAVRTSFDSRGSRRAESRTTRSGATRGVLHSRTVSSGSSASAVPIPTSTASYPARSRCASTMAAPSLTRVLDPGASASRASSEMAYFNAKNGRCREKVFRCTALRSLASTSQTASSTSIPCSRSQSAPPAASGLGSRVPQTTRAMPAAAIARLQGPVFPLWWQGSRFT